MQTPPTKDELLLNFQARTLLPFCTIHNLDYNQILARAKLEKWPLTPPTEPPTTIAALEIEISGPTPLDRGRKYAERMAKLISHNVLPFLESKTPTEILDNIDAIEKSDKIARRSYGLDAESATGGPTLNVQILNQGVEAFVKVQSSAPPILPEHK